MRPTTVFLIISLFLNLCLAFFFRNNIRQLFLPAQTDKKTASFLNKDDSTLKYYTPAPLSIYGKYHNENNYARLDSSCKAKVRPEVWHFGQHSAGMSVRFKTNSPMISVKWSLIKAETMDIMTDIGTNGIDLYCFKNGAWQFVDAGIPTGIHNEYRVIENMDSTTKEFLLNLPLYNGVKTLEIGVTKSATLQFIPKKENHKPIAFYGTSITQGASASRPGMAYTSIISRALQTEVINLGFSGNGKFEPAVGEVLCGIDAALYVLDCTPNCTAQFIEENAFLLIQQLNYCRPDVPILLVESMVREESYFNGGSDDIYCSLAYVHAQNEALKSVYELAIKNGIKNLYYLEHPNLIGNDHEASVDGTHLSDLGMYRLADKIGDKINAILGIQ